MFNRWDHRRGVVALDESLSLARRFAGVSGTISMIVTPEMDRRNRQLARAAAGVVAAGAVGGGWFYPFLLWGLALAPFVYGLLRARCLQRLRALARPFPPRWELILNTRVAYYGALSEEEKERFRQMVKVFLEEVRITGIRTDVDDTVRVLVAASAIIPVLGFPDWEYSRLAEVLVYPSRFGEDYRTAGRVDENILGLVGPGNLSGIMVLSKPDLLAGFDNPSDKRNVGIHEFAHLVDRGDGVFDGLPPGCPPETTRRWIEYVANELARPPEGRSHINRYGYTNKVELFAVLAEYFFESPSALERKDPELYRMLREMFHQDSKTILARAVLPLRRKIGRNSPCPCGSGRKYKKCCLHTADVAWEN